MQCEMLSEFPHPVLPLPRNDYIGVTSYCDLTNALLIHQCACICQSERQTLIQ